MDGRTMGLVLALGALATAIVAAILALRTQGGRRILLVTLTLVLILVGAVGLLQLRLANRPAPVPDALSLYTLDRPASTVVALRARDGALRWRHPLGQLGLQPAGGPVASGDGIYVDTFVGMNSLLSTTLLALRPSDGGELWRATLDGFALSVPVVRDGTL